MQFKQMVVTAVCVLFLLKLKWPKSMNFYENLQFSSERSGGLKGYLISMPLAIREEPVLMNYSLTSSSERLPLMLHATLLQKTTVL